MITINKINKANLSKIKTILDNSGIIIFPTETVWGIACKFDDEIAVKKIYDIKGRNFSNPLQIQLSAISEIEKYTLNQINGELSDICNAFLPGPLSIVLKKNNVPDFITSNLDTVSIRISSCSIVTELVNYMGYPLASTSCNYSGEPVLTDIGNVKEFAEKHCDIFISMTCNSQNISSTVIAFEDNSLKLLREGVITFDEIINVINK